MKPVPAAITRGGASVAGRLAAISKKERHAVLCTGGGQPYASLIAFALTPDARELLFATPRRSTKYRNILRNSRVALLIDTRANSDRAYLTSEAVTVLGIARPLRASARRAGLAEIFLRRHPRLKEFIAAQGTALVSVKITKCIHVTAFQTVTEELF